MNCRLLLPIGLLCLSRFSCLFISEEKPDNAGMPESRVDLVEPAKTSTMSAIELCSVTATFGIVLETNEHQNHTRLRQPIFSPLILFAASFSGPILKLKHKYCQPEILHHSVIHFHHKILSMANKASEHLSPTQIHSKDLHRIAGTKVYT